MGSTSSSPLGALVSSARKTKDIGLARFGRLILAVCPRAQVSPLYELSRTRERSNLYRTASENRSLRVEPTDVWSKCVHLRWTDRAQETWGLTGLRCLLKGVSDLDQSGFAPGAAEE
jgi:hypothetical protein